VSEAKASPAYQREVCIANFATNEIRIESDFILTDAELFPLSGEASKFHNLMTSISDFTCDWLDKEDLHKRFMKIRGFLFER